MSISTQQIPPPTGQVLSLVSALSNTANHELHLQAIRARDEALSASPESYSNLCVQLCYLLVGSDQPSVLMQRINPGDLEQWRQTDMATASRLQQDESHWTPFGQMAGLVLKTALLHPPYLSDGRPLYVVSPASDQLKAALLSCLGCQHSELRAVASSIIATSSVSQDGIQPLLYIKTWPDLIPALVANLKQQQSSPLVEGSLLTIKKMMEDGPKELDQQQLDSLVPLLLQYLKSDNERCKVSALQSLVACHSDQMLPSALVLHFNDYLAALSALSTDPSALVRKWVCRSIVQLLLLRTEYIQDHLQPICQFMLQSTSDSAHEQVALEACEYWLTFATLDEDICSPGMVETFGAVLPQLIPVLLQNMVYSQDQRAELLAQNEIDMEAPTTQGGMRPLFHKSRNKHGGGGDNSDDEDDDGDGDDFDDEDGNEWTLRKCAAASLDSLSNVYGASVILPNLLPSLEQGLASTDPWVQEASILALGAVAEGCREEMNEHMAQLYPYLMNHLSTPEAPTNLPQVKSIAAWTIGRYSAWVVEQVQIGQQGHLLAQVTEVFLDRMKERNRRVQVACCSAFGVMMEMAGDLMVPYLEPIFQNLVEALSRYQGRSLVVLFDTIGIMADFVGSAIGEGVFPGMYLPPLMQMWDGLAKNDPTDRTLLPLMECLASLCVTVGMNYQPYALDTFNNAMCMIESVTLLNVSEGGKLADEDVDPIVCAADILDGLVEGLGVNFGSLVSSSPRYGPAFPSVLHALCSHEIPGVRMSGLALLGDLARNAPAVIESGLPQLIQEATSNMDPIQPTVCNNAVWALGEICVRCGDNSKPLEPFAPAIMQNLVALLMGNGVNGRGRAADIPGLAENASGAAGRLAKLNPNFVAPDLPRFLMGWCDGMAKITDPAERRDAFQGFIVALYANPQCIQSAAANTTDAIASILFAIVSWHMPPPETDYDLPDLLHGTYAFHPFPSYESELRNSLAQLIVDIKNSIGEEAWVAVQKQLPVNVRRLLREAYQL